ncbi:hypothetical protein, partial [Methylobacterium soli]|uniref:hypothetical protein n=1 Tax=Methylobacterium soli TaxID=553447 RepID=UPI001EE2EE94
PISNGSPNDQTTRTCLISQQPERPLRPTRFCANEISTAGSDPLSGVFGEFCSQARRLGLVSFGGSFDSPA